MRVRPFLAALLLPPVITAATLALVAWNRAGGRGPIVLSEREVYAGPLNDDNTTSTLWLAWRSDGSGPGVPGPGSGDRGAGSEQGFAALELRDDAPDAPDAAAGFGRKESRLVVVGVDRDAATLERRYPDGRTHVITAATISVPADGAYEKGTVVTLQPMRLSVPRELAGPLAGRGSFDVEVWYGLRYEPWISAIRPR